MVIEFQVSTYRIVMGPAIPLPEGKCYAYIDMAAHKNESIVAYFMHDGPLPPNSYSASPPTGHIYLPASQFSWYVDILRNEMPVQARLHPTEPDKHTIRTWFEPVGEGEQ